MREGAPPDPTDLSRRTLLGAPAAASALLTSLANLPAGDDCIPLCRLWLARETEQADLFRRHSEVEEVLLRCHRWAVLTPEERQALPEAAPLHAIDARLRELFDLRQALASKLPRSRAFSREGVMLKFEVVTRELHTEDFPAIHGLLKSAVRDLSILW